MTPEQLRQRRRERKTIRPISAEKEAAYWDYWRRATKIGLYPFPPDKFYDEPSILVTLESCEILKNEGAEAFARFCTERLRG